MPEKEITKQAWILLIVIPFLVTLAQRLSTFTNIGAGCTLPSWKDTIVHLIVGVISGVLFGFLGGWLTSGDQFAVGATAGFGTVLGIHGVQRVATTLEKALTKKIDKI